MSKKPKRIRGKLTDKQYDAFGNELKPGQHYKIKPIPGVQESPIVPDKPIKDKPSEVPTPDNLRPYDRTYQETLRKIERKKIRPTSFSPRLVDDAKKIYGRTIRFNDDISTDTIDYLNTSINSGLFYNYDLEGNPVLDDRNPVNCVTEDQCHSGGDNWDTDSQFYTNNDIGDCYFSDDVCKYMCKAYCGGVEECGGYLIGDDGNRWYPVYSTGYADVFDFLDDVGLDVCSFIPNGGLGIYNECGAPQAHPADCNEYSIIWSDRESSDCYSDGWFDSACRCTCAHRRAYVQKNEGLDTGEAVQVYTCLDENACNLYGGFGAPAGTYAWCSEDAYNGLYEEYCINAIAECDYSCYGCTDVTSIDYDSQATKACNGTYGPGGQTGHSYGSGWNSCCDYDRIRQTANRFKLIYNWDFHKIKLRGDNLIKEQGESDYISYIWWTGQVSAQQGITINWDTFDDNGSFVDDDLHSDTGLYFEVGKPFWLKEVREERTCYLDVIDPLTGNQGTQVCCTPVVGTMNACSPNITCGYDFTDDSGVRYTAMASSDESVYSTPSPQCVTKVKVVIDEKPVPVEVPELGNLARYEYRATNESIDRDGYIYLNTQTGIQGAGNQTGVWMSWSTLNTDLTLNHSWADNVYYDEALVQTQYDMDIILDNAGTFKTWREHDPYDSQYGEYVINTPGGMFRRPGKPFYEGIYEIDTNHPYAGYDNDGEEIYCEKWDGTPADYCGKFKLSFCNNEIDESVDYRWASSDRIDTLFNKERIWKPRKINPGDGWYNSHPGELNEGVGSVGPCRYLSSGIDDEELHLSVNKMVLYERPDEIPNSGYQYTDDNGDTVDVTYSAKFRHGSCITTPINHKTKTFTGYFPIDLDATMDDYGIMINGPITGEVIDGGYNIERGTSSIRRGHFRSGCVGPLGGCFDCQAIQSKFSCEKTFSVKGCEWNDQNEVCLNSDPSLGACAEDDSPLTYTDCLPGKDDFNLCIGDQTGPYEGSVGEGISGDGDNLSKFCAGLNYDSVFVYNTGTILDGARWKQTTPNGEDIIDPDQGPDDDLSVMGWESGFKWKQNWNPGINATGPNPSVIPFDSRWDRVAEGDYPTQEVGTDLRRLNGNFDNMHRADHWTFRGNINRFTCFDYYGQTPDNWIGPDIDDPYCYVGTWNIDYKPANDPNDSGRSTGMVQIGSTRKNLITPQIIDINVQYEDASRSRGTSRNGEISIENCGTHCINYENTPFSVCETGSGVQGSNAPNGVWCDCYGPTGGFNTCPGFDREACCGTSQGDSACEDIVEFFECIVSGCYYSNGICTDEEPEPESGYTLIDTSYSTRFELLGEHSHPDSNYQNKWHGINNYNPKEQEFLEHKLIQGNVPPDDEGGMRHYLQFATAGVDWSPSGGDIDFGNATVTLYGDGQGLGNERTDYWAVNVCKYIHPRGFPVIDSETLQYGCDELEYWYNIAGQDFPNSPPPRPQDGWCQGTNTNTDWACNWDVSNDVADVSRHYTVKNVYNQPDDYTSTGIMTAYKLLEQDVGYPLGLMYPMYWLWSQFGSHQNLEYVGSLGRTTYDTYNGNVSLMNYVFNRGALFEFLQDYHGIGGLGTPDGITWPTGMMPYCIDQQEFMSDCEPLESWTSEQRETECFQKPIARFYKKFYDFWRGEPLGNAYALGYVGGTEENPEFVGDNWPTNVYVPLNTNIDGGANFLPETYEDADRGGPPSSNGTDVNDSYWTKWYVGYGDHDNKKPWNLYDNDTKGHREITLGANKYTIDLFCQSLGFDAGKILTWTSSSTGCSNGFRRLVFEPYYSDGSNPYDSAVPKLFIAHGQANEYDLQSNQYMWPSRKPMFEDLSYFNHTWEGTGYRGLSDMDSFRNYYDHNNNLTDDEVYEAYGRGTGFYCPYGSAVRPHDIACYSHDIWSPAQNYIYGEARHNSYQARCTSNFTQADVKAWMKAYYFAYYDRRIGWSNAFEHPIFGEEVPYKISIGDPDWTKQQEIVRECGPEIIVTPAHSFVNDAGNAYIIGHGWVNQWHKYTYGLLSVDNDTNEPIESQDNNPASYGASAIMVDSSPEGQCGPRDMWVTPTGDYVYSDPTDIFTQVVKNGCPKGSTCHVSLLNGSHCVEDITGENITLDNHLEESGPIHDGSIIYEDEILERAMRDSSGREKIVKINMFEGEGLDITQTLIE